LFDNVEEEKTGVMVEL